MGIHHQHIDSLIAFHPVTNPHIRGQSVRIRIREYQHIDIPPSPRIIGSRTVEVGPAVHPVQSLPECTALEFGEPHGTILAQSTNPANSVILKTP